MSDSANCVSLEVDLSYQNFLVFWIAPETAIRWHAGPSTKYFVISNDFDALWWFHKFQNRTEQSNSCDDVCCQINQFLCDGPIKIMRLMYSPASSHGPRQSLFHIPSLRIALIELGQQWIYRETNALFRPNKSSSKRIFFIILSSHMRFMTFANSKISFPPVFCYPGPHCLCHWCSFPRVARQFTLHNRKRTFVLNFISRMCMIEVGLRPTTLQCGKTQWKSYIGFNKLLFQLHWIQLKSLCEHEAKRRDEHPTYISFLVGSLIAFVGDRSLCVRLSALSGPAHGEAGILHE